MKPGRTRQMHWKNILLSLLGVSLVSVAGFWATGMDGFAAAGAVAIVLLLCAAWVWTIQILVVVGERQLVVGYVVALLVAAVVSATGLYATGIGDFAITGTIAIALLVLAAEVLIIQCLKFSTPQGEQL